MPEICYPAATVIGRALAVANRKESGQHDERAI